jgi:hypothetical protein
MQGLFRCSPNSKLQVVFELKTEEFPYVTVPINVSHEHTLQVFFDREEQGYIGVCTEGLHYDNC